MIKAVIFDMYETLVTLFSGTPYFGDGMAKDAGTYSYASFDQRAWVKDRTNQ